MKWYEPPRKVDLDCWWPAVVEVFLVNLDTEEAQEIYQQIKDMPLPWFIDT
jgi:hypothetical protein